MNEKKLKALATVVETAILIKEVLYKVSFINNDYDVYCDPVIDDKYMIPANLSLTDFVDYAKSVLTAEEKKINEEYTNAIHGRNRHYNDILALMKRDCDWREYAPDYYRNSEEYAPLPDICWELVYTATDTYGIQGENGKYAVKIDMLNYYTLYFDSEDDVRLFRSLFNGNMTVETERECA